MKSEDSVFLEKLKHERVGCLKDLSKIRKVLYRLEKLIEVYEKSPPTLVDDGSLDSAYDVGPGAGRVVTVDAGPENSSKPSPAPKKKKSVSGMRHVDIFCEVLYLKEGKFLTPRQIAGCARRKGLSETPISTLSIRMGYQGGRFRRGLVKAPDWLEFRGYANTWEYRRKPDPEKWRDL